MPADIEEGLHAEITAAHRDDGLSEKIQRVIVAGIRDVVEVAYDLPRRGEHLLLFSAQEIRVPVYPSGQTEVLFQCRALCVHYHGSSQLLLNDSITRRTVKICEVFRAESAERRRRIGHSPNPRKCR